MHASAPSPVRPTRPKPGSPISRRTLLPWIKENGGQGGILLLDRETGKAVAITLWNDEETMRSSEQAANEHRSRVSGQMQGTQSPTVERYEVAVFDA